MNRYIYIVQLHDGCFTLAEDGAELDRMVSDRWQQVSKIITADPSYLDAMPTEVLAKLEDVRK